MADSVQMDLLTSSEVVARTDPVEILKAADIVTDAIVGKKKVIVMGDGASSADAQHMATEFSGKYLFDRPPMAGTSLSDIVQFMEIGDDLSFDSVYERQLRSFCEKGDVVIGLSAFGTSEIIRNAFIVAREIGAVSILITGDCGVLKDIADCSVIIHSDIVPKIQEGSFVSAHIICGLVERNLFGKKAVLIDRDDTIVKDVPHCTNPDDIHLFPGVAKAISRLNEAGYLVILITNQSVIGRGMIDESGLESIHNKLKKDISDGGGRIDDIFFCPHHPDAGCDCRKPKIGMGVKAISKYNIDTRHSYMIGDSDKDIQFGRSIGCMTKMVTADFTFVDAVNEILSD